MHKVENLVQIDLVGQFFEGVGVSESVQLGDSFTEIELKRFPLIRYGITQGFIDFFRVYSIKESIQRITDKQQRDNRKAGYSQPMSPPNFSIVSFHGAHSPLSLKFLRQAEPIEMSWMTGAKMDIHA